MAKSFRKPYKKTVYVPLMTYSWSVQDENIIGDGFLPYYNTLHDYEEDYPETDYIELEIISTDPPEQIFKINLN